MKKRILNLLLCYALILSLACPTLAAGTATEQDIAAASLRTQGSWPETRGGS